MLGLVPTEGKFQFYKSSEQLWIFMITGFTENFQTHTNEYFFFFSQKVFAHTYEKICVRMCKNWMYTIYYPFHIWRILLFLKTMSNYSCQSERPPFYMQCRSKQCRAHSALIALWLRAWNKPRETFSGLVLPSFNETCYEFQGKTLS